MWPRPRVHLNPLLAHLGTLGDRWSMCCLCSQTRTATTSQDRLRPHHPTRLASRRRPCSASKTKQTRPLPGGEFWRFRTHTWWVCGILWQWVLYMVIFRPYRMQSARLLKSRNFEPVAILKYIQLFNVANCIFIRDHRIVKVTPSVNLTVQLFSSIGAL